jgi:hypothetical protein
MISELQNHYLLLGIIYLRWSVLYKYNFNTLICNFIVLVHWSNSLWVDMSPLTDIFVFLSSPPVWSEAIHTNFIVFVFTRSRHWSTIYHTRGKHTNYTTNAVLGDIQLCRWIWIILLTWHILFMSQAFKQDFVKNKGFSMG